MRTYNIDIAAIDAGDNDRKFFDKVQLDLLAQNIKDNGLLQPIMVRPIADDRYEIILGERRYRACKQLGMAKIAAVVQDVTDEEASAGMLSENMARANLDAIEEAQAYQSRIARFGWSVDYVAQVAGVTTVRVLFRLKLLRLREDLQQLVRTENLGLGYAQILADAELDTNRQAMAVDALRDNGTPTPAWFRRICGELLAQQSQTSAFDMLEDAGMCAPQVELVASAPMGIFVMPEQTTKIAEAGIAVPPIVGDTTIEILKNQAAFWREAGRRWDNKGKNFKRDGCYAAAHALDCAIEAISN
jgi:ParB/RepB/Spo0J family partition protein